MNSSLQIRDSVATIEAAAHAAGQRLAAAEATHQAAMRIAVAANTAADYAGLSSTEAELADARAASDRAFANLATARAMLAEALAAERQAEQDAARADIEGRISEMESLAADLDADFAGLCARLVQLRTLEFAARAVVRDAFGASPPANPQAMTAADVWATHLRSRFDGLGLSPAPAVATAIRAGATLIRQGCQP